MTGIRPLRAALEKGARAGGNARICCIVVAATSVEPLEGSSIASVFVAMPKPKSMSGSKQAEKHNAEGRLPARMMAMAFERARAPLQRGERTLRRPRARHILLRVSACAVCRADLHVIDGELPNPKAHVIPGHEIIGRAHRLRA
jgi:Alcohol dehydrogenase GroES-like domain